MSEEWLALPKAKRDEQLVQMRLDLRAEGERTGDMMVFSFWPDTIMIKEVGDPLAIGEYLQLGREELHARHILAQGVRTPTTPLTCMPAIPFH